MNVPRSTLADRADTADVTISVRRFYTKSAQYLAVPEAALRFCSIPGCSQKVRAGRCPTHSSKDPWQTYRQTQVSRTRGRKLQRLRDALFTRQPFCYICHERLATIRDHVVNLAAGGSDTEDNAAGICEDCHKAKTHAEAMRGRLR